MTMYVKTSPCVHPFPEMLDACTFIPSNIIKMSWNKKPILTIGFIQGNPKVLSPSFFTYWFIISSARYITFTKPFLNIYYPIIKVYRSGQFECNCITDLSLNIQPTISLQPLTLYRYGVDRPAHMLSMIDGFIVHIHGHVSRRSC